MVLENLNVRREAGAFKAYVREFPGIRPQMAPSNWALIPLQAMIRAIKLLPLE
jgi:hypothetical protein